MYFDARDAAKGSPPRTLRATFDAARAEICLRWSTRGARVRRRAGAWRIRYSASRPVPKNRPNPSALRYLWQERRTSTMGIDQSGVWRFRDLLPIVAVRPGGDAAGGEYAAVRDAEVGGGAGAELAAGQAPGDESDGVVQGYGDDGGAVGGGGERVRVGGVCFDGEYVGGDGGVCGAGGAAQHGADPGGKDCVGQAVAGDGLWVDDGAAADGL